MRRGRRWCARARCDLRPRDELVDLAEQNARHLLEEFKLASSEAEERATNPVYELQRELGLTFLLSAERLRAIAGDGLFTADTAAPNWGTNCRPK